MPDLPTAGKRILNQLLTTVSPSTTDLLDGAQLPTLTQTQSSPAAISDATKRALFEQALSEVEAASQASDDFLQVVSEPATSQEQAYLDTAASFAQSLPLAVDQQLAEEQMQVGGPRKESLEGGRSAPVIEAAVSNTPVEVEHSAEIAPEVESYIDEVIDHAAEVPEEMVIAEPVVIAPHSAPATRTVKVLPLTKAQAELAKKKGPEFSIRWLYEFSDKIARMLSGGTIYRPEN